MPSQTCHILKKTALLMPLLLFACTPDPPPPEEYANPYAPGHNEFLQQEAYVGSDGKSSWFYASEKSYSDGSFYVLSELDAAQASTSISVGQTAFQDFYETAFIKVDAQGHKIWEQRPGFYCRSLIVLKPGLLAQKEMILLIGTDSNDDDKGRNRIMIFDGDGNFVFNQSSDFPYYHFDIELMNNGPDFLEFISAGCASYLNGEIIPTFYRFKIKKNNIGFLSEDVYQVPLKKHTFTNVELVDGKIIASGTEEDFNDQTDAQTVFIQAFQFNMKSVWGYDIQRNGKTMSHRWRQLTSDGDKVYLCFSSEDQDKAKTTLGSYWESFFVYAFDPDNGNVAWNYKYPISEYGDVANAMIYSAPYLYLNGVTAGHSKDDKYYCLSFIAKLKTSNGDFASEVKTFGDQYNGNVIETCIVNPDYTHAFGYLQKDKEQSKGWLFSVFTKDL